MFVIPKINGIISMKNSTGYFLIKDKIQVNVGEFTPWAISSFAERIKKSCEISVSITGSNADILIEKDSFLDSEGYSIEIQSDTVILRASNENGIVWGLTTLYQMFVEASQNNEKKIPLQTFSDHPKYKHRGLMIDVGRHFFEPEEIKKIIEEMSVYKLNVLHWHLSEDQGWRIESKIFPKLQENASNGQYYTQEQIKDIVNFAKERGIDVIPEIDMPGHASAIISAYKELSCFDEEIPVREGYGVFRVVMCAGKESTYKWIFNLMDEISELFPSKYFHLGGDECPKDKWKICPHCNELMNSNNIDNYDDLQGYFMNRIREYLKSKGKTVIGWNESLKAKNVSKDMVIQYWLESTAESYSYPYFEAGQKLIFSDMFSLYFDYPHFIVKLKKTYEYQPKIRDHLHLEGDNIMGLEGTIWTERVLTNEKLESMISPRIQALAEAAWTNERNYEDFLERLKAHINTKEITKLSALPLEEVALSDEQAKKLAIENMRAMSAEASETFTDTGLPQDEQDRIGSMFKAEVFGVTDL
ncbi:MAG: beta-N-acetylhexosaminidase [Neobacillus sp.]